MQAGALKVNPFFFLSGIEKEQREYNFTATLGDF